MYAKTYNIELPLHIEQCIKWLQKRTTDANIMRSIKNYGIFV